MRSDLLGRIAQARADMMLRGHRDLRLEIGPMARSHLCYDLGAIDSWEADAAVAVIGLPAPVIRFDMEGFALIATRDGMDAEIPPKTEFGAEDPPR